MADSAARPCGDRNAKSNAGITQAINGGRLNTKVFILEKEAVIAQPHDLIPPS